VLAILIFLTPLDTTLKSIKREGNPQDFSTVKGIGFRIRFTEAITELKANGCVKSQREVPIYIKRT